MTSSYLKIVIIYKKANVPLYRPINFYFLVLIVVLGLKYDRNVRYFECHLVI